MAHPKSNRSKPPVEAKCSEYRCPCHDKLAQFMAVVTDNESVAEAWREMFGEEPEDFVEQLYAPETKVS